MIIRMNRIIFFNFNAIVLAIILQSVQTYASQSNIAEPSSTQIYQSSSEVKSSSNYAELGDLEPSTSDDITDNVTETNQPTDYSTDRIASKQSEEVDESAEASSLATAGTDDGNYTTDEIGSTTDSYDKYVTIAFVTNNPKNKTNVEISTGRNEKSTQFDEESTIFKFWTTLSEGNAHQRTSTFDDRKSSIVETSSPNHFSVSFVQNNVPTSGHLVTVQPFVKNSTMSESTVSESKIGDDLNLDLSDYDLVDVSDENDEDVEDEATVSEKKYIEEAVEYGLKKMKELYEVEEPKLYNMGLWLENDNPARFVATFNWQSEEARKYAQFGYASLQASNHLKQKLNDDLEGRSNTILPKLNALKKSLLREQCPLRGTPRCPPASKRYRTHDGTCNNLRRGRWGSALTPVERFLPPAYSDGAGEARGFGDDRLPSPRVVSEHVHSGRREDASALTHLLMQWGQFLDHDITSSSQSRSFNGSVPRCCMDGGRRFVPAQFLHPECLPIEVPDDDPFYGPKGIRCLEFVRSSTAPRIDCEFGWREQMNQVTAFIDASPIYSSSARQADKLRIFRNGMLQYGRAQARRPLLPPREDDEEALCRGGAVDASCFKAGDGRVNEHPGLVAMHIIWLRKHNRLATELSHLNPHWSDEKIYQETRKIIGAFIQHITYREFLPIVLGSEVMRLFDLNLVNKGYYKGYNSKVNPSPANAFGAAAFRFGHSLVQDSFMRYDRFHRPLANNVSLHDELTNPSNIWSFGAVDRLVFGMCNQPSQKRDEFISPELTNHLFQTSRFGFGMDLAAINIQRGRDHGIPPYVDWRQPCGLTAIEGWADLFNIMPSRTVRNLRDIYRRVDDIDLFTGGMSERPVIGGLVGPTFACIIAQQFSNLRRGDRFWYENGGFESSFTPAQLQQIRKITLAQILCQTLESIETIQPFVFLASDDLRNERLSCNRKLLNNFDLTPWTERGPDLTNDINDFDRANFVKSSSVRPHSSIKTSTRSSSTPTPTTKLTTDSKLDTNPTTTQTIKIKDKLNFSDELSTNTEPTVKLDTKLDLKNDETLFSSDNTTQSTKIDDKLDAPFTDLQKTLDKDDNDIKNTDDLQQFDKRSFSNSVNSTFQKRYNISTFDHSNRTKYAEYLSQNKKQKPVYEESSVKTLGFLLNNDSQLPFFDLFRRTTTEKIITRPRPKPQLDYYNNPLTDNPNRYTYLINIVPQTTTPRYVSNLPQKETIKITVQGAQPQKTRPSSFPYDKRPVFDNNRLEYRPINTYPQIVNQDSSYNYNDNPPQVSIPRPKPTSNSYNRPQSNPFNDIPDSYFNTNQQDTDLIQNVFNTRPNRPNRPNRPYRPSNDYTTEYNPYTLVTFSHIETTKPYNNYNSPDTYYTNKLPTRPSSDDTAYFGQKPRPVLYDDRPANTGITIYIESSPAKPKPTNAFPLNQANGYGSSNARPIIQSSYDSEETVPLFTRPSYQRPLSNSQSSSNTYSRPSNFNNPLQSEYGQFSNTFSSQSNSYNKENYQQNKPNKVRPSNVNINLASEYGTQSHTDLSIVIDPNLQNRPQSNQQNPYQSFHKSYSTLKPPTKYYYIGNVLHKYPDDEDPNKFIKRQQSDFTRREILKENYNNIWKPDKNEHSLYYGTQDSKEDVDIENEQNTKSTLYENVSSESRDDLNQTIPENQSRNSNSENARHSESIIPIKNQKSKTNKLNANKIKDQVFFEVIPSENSPMTWITYNEKPDEFSTDDTYNVMPKLDIDPYASEELPRPMNITSFMNKMKH